MPIKRHIIINHYLSPLNTLYFEFLLSNYNISFSQLTVSSNEQQVLKNISLQSSLFFRTIKSIKFKSITFTHLQLHTTMAWKVMETSIQLVVDFTVTYMGK